MSAVYFERKVILLQGSVNLWGILSDVSNAVIKGTVISFIIMHIDIFFVCLCWLSWHYPFWLKIQVFSLRQISQ